MKINRRKIQKIVDVCGIVDQIDWILNDNVKISLISEYNQRFNADPIIQTAIEQDQKGKKIMSDLNKYEENYTKGILWLGTIIQNSGITDKNAGNVLRRSYEIYEKLLIEHEKIIDKRKYALLALMQNVSYKEGWERRGVVWNEARKINTTGFMEKLKEFLKDEEDFTMCEIDSKNPFKINVVNLAEMLDRANGIKRTEDERFTEDNIFPLINAIYLDNLEIVFKPKVLGEFIRKVVIRKALVERGIVNENEVVKLTDDELLEKSIEYNEDYEYRIILREALYEKIMENKNYCNYTALQLYATYGYKVFLERYLINNEPNQKEENAVCSIAVQMARVCEELEENKETKQLKINMRRKTKDGKSKRITYKMKDLKEDRDRALLCIGYRNCQYIKQNILKGQKKAPEEIEKIEEVYNSIIAVYNDLVKKGEREEKEIKVLILNIRENNMTKEVKYSISDLKKDIKELKEEILPSRFFMPEEEKDGVLKGLKEIPIILPEFKRVRNEDILAKGASDKLKSDWRLTLREGYTSPSKKMQILCLDPDVNMYKGIEGTAYEGYVVAEYPSREFAIIECIGENDRDGNMRYPYGNATVVVKKEYIDKVLNSKKRLENIPKNKELNVSTEEIKLQGRKEDKEQVITGCNSQEIYAVRKNHGKSWEKWIIGVVNGEIDPFKSTIKTPKKVRTKETPEIEKEGTTGPIIPGEE